VIETRWWWIRHAPVTIHGGRIYGQRDLACDCTDPALFGWLARELPAGALWVTTPLARTRQTAEAILAAGAPVPAERAEEAAFVEQDFGDWQGLSYDELKGRRDGSVHRFWHAPASETPPGGESFAVVVARVSAAIESLGRRHTERDIVVVAHGGSIRAALAHALGLEAERALGFAIENCSLTRLDHFAADRAWRVGGVNLLRRGAPGP
jgi:alpha-ribazole phosphatase